MKTNDQTHNDSFIPENPKKEAKDPNIGKSLTDSLKAARRNLVIVCGIAIAWATAQFTKSEPNIEFVGVTLERQASFETTYKVFLEFPVERQAIEQQRDALGCC